MAHWKSMTDTRFIFAFDLAGKDVNVKIERVEAGVLESNGGRKAKKPLVFFKGVPKPLALNSTNAKTIAAICGSNDTDDWIGKWITMYPSQTQFGNDTVDCIRIRPKAPVINGAKEAKAEQGAVEQPATEERASS